VFSNCYPYDRFASVLLSCVLILIKAGATKTGDNKKGKTEILFFCFVACAYNTGSSPTSPSNIFDAKFSDALFYMNFVNCALFEAKYLVHVSDRIMLF